MMTSSDPYYYAYIVPCLNCDGSGRQSPGSEDTVDPYLFICSTCDKKMQEKGVLLNNKRMFLNNVG